MHESTDFSFENPCCHGDITAVANGAAWLDGEFLQLMPLLQLLNHVFSNLEGKPRKQLRVVGDPGAQGGADLWISVQDKS